MKSTRLTRVFWILGVVLLVGTVAGSGWMLNRPEDNGAGPMPNVTVPFGGKGIVALGHVDVEPGITRLYPAQLGKVVWVIDENKKVSQGDVLLRVDDRQAQAKLAEAKIAREQAEKTRAEAKIALEQAKLTLEDAKLYPQQHALKIKQQQAAIDAAAHAEKEAKRKLAQAEEYLKTGALKEEQLEEPKTLVKRLTALVTVETEKLNELKLEVPERKVEQAKLDVEYKERLLEQAKLNVEHKEQLVKQAEVAVEQTKILAPHNGFVLRVHTRPGEVLGPSPTAPAIEFCPDLPKIVRAEVLQEWAAKVQVGQDAVIEDETSSSYQWKGKVVRLSNWITHRRSIIQEPFQFNDVRTLEAVVSVQEARDRPLRIGQRMRVMINQGGP